MYYVIKTLDSSCMTKIQNVSHPQNLQRAFDKSKIGFYSSQNALNDFPIKFVSSCIDAKFWFHCRKGVSSYLLCIMNMHLVLVWWIDKPNFHTQHRIKVFIPVRSKKSQNTVYDEQYQNHYCQNIWMDCITPWNIFQLLWTRGVHCIPKTCMH